MPPKFILHVLIAKGFEVWGQRPVQLQEAPIQGPDARDVRSRHSAARADHQPRLRRGMARAAPLRSRVLKGRNSGGRGRATFLRFGPP